jgi:hypothetical protein
MTSLAAYVRYSKGTASDYGPGASGGDVRRVAPGFAEARGQGPGLLGAGERRPAAR